jgi:filamentous hemagglutinin family protein
MKRHASMNRLYRLLWSQAAGAWIAVAETVRRQGKSACGRRLLAATLLLSGPIVHAAPVGGQIVSGAGSISEAGAITTIRQSSPTLSLNWKTFNIAPQETVDFLQPSAASIAVNRIFDTNGSQILGHLNANGQVYLINVNGILFGQGAQVNVAGLVASTLNVSDLAMVGATRSFSGDSTASVVNAGTINTSSGGYVVLAGNHVSNQGTIIAQMGTVALAAGSAATLTFSGNSLLHMQVDQSVVNSVAENGGLIRADGGQVFMTAGAKKTLLASVVNNSGVIQARSIENQDGNIVLLGGMQAGQVLVGGTLDVSSTSGTGGQIVATAQSVLVSDGASVQASGAAGGGTIAIGAGWEGGGGIDQATTVAVSKTATLNASATAIGNGGTISVRSAVDNPNSTARVYGTLLAHGGANGGNGGRIETSGHWLDVTGITVDSSAARGAAGEWLLDPYNVIIGAAASGTAYNPPSYTFTPAADSTILASTINTALNGGNSVTITTGTTGSSLGDITVNTAISKASGANVTLTLQAADSVIVNQPITNTSTAGVLNVTILADNDEGVHNGVGVVILNNSITTKGGLIAFGDGTTYNPGGSATAYEDGGDVYVGGSSPVTLSTAGGAVGVHGQLIIANTGGLSISTANGNVTVDGLIDSGDSYAFVASANVTWTAAKLAASSGTGANVGDTYLATITSRLENAVAGSAAGYVASWLGAERVVGIGTDAIWRWVTGPEGLQNNGQGLEFFTQNGTETGNDNGSDKGGTPINGAYVNWNPATPEPNNSGGMNLSAGGLSEYVMQFVGTAGLWNDLAPTSALTGYVKETNLAPSALNVSAGTGVVTFSQALGSNKPLASINVSAQTIALPSPAVLNSTGPQSFTGQVTVGGTNVNLLTVSANNLTTLYGGAVPALTTTYSGFVNGNTVASLTSAATETLSASAQPVVGSYPITPSGVVDPNYFIVYNPALLIVNPATLTITASTASKTYDQVNPALTAGYSGFQYSDTVASLTTAATASTTAVTASNVGSYPTTAAGAVASANYTIAYVPGTLTVNPITLTVSGFSGTGRAYNASVIDALSGAGTLTGLVAGQTLTLGNTNGTLGAADAGSETITSNITLGDGTGGGLAANYVLTQPTLPNVTISPAALSVTGSTANNKVYDGTAAATLTGTLSGVFGSDAVTLLPGGSFGSKDVGTGIAVTATDTLSGAQAFDYTLTQPTGLAANITPLAITVSATGTNKVYDGGINDAATLTSAGLIPGDTVIFSDTSAVFGNKNVGNGKPIAISGISASGPQAFDYMVINATASTTANITQLGSVVWIGPASGGSWSNPANWAGGAIPDLSNVADVVIPIGDNVTFDSSVAGPVNISQLSSGGLTVDSGTLNVATALDLTNFAQSGGTVGGTGSFTVTNSFTQTAGQIALSGGALSINQAMGDLSFANISAGSATLNSSLGAVMLGNLTTSGNLIVAAEGGGVTQSPGATLAVGGTTGLAASNAGTPADISLTNAGNVLVAAVSATGAQVSITDSVPLMLGMVDASEDLLVNSTGGLDLGNSSIGGNLVANSGNGNVTQEGALSVAGTTNITAGTGNVLLNNAANILGNTVTTSGQLVSLTNAVPLNLGIVATGGNLLVNSTGGLNLGTSNVGGNLVVNSGNGNVTQDGALSVDGTTDIVAGTGSVQLNNPGNVFQGALTASGSNVRVGGDVNAFALDASIDSAVSQLESDALSTDPGNPPDALTLSSTVSESRDGELVQITMNIGVNGPQLHILNGGMRLPDDGISVARIRN